MKAIITGVTGQDGAYLAKLLIGKGYSVAGLVRSYFHSHMNGLEYLGIANKVFIKECDLSDLSQVLTIINEEQPDEIYNLAAQSSVSLSFSQPMGTINFNVFSVLNILESIKLLKPNTKFYQASSSEIFGVSDKLPFTETSNIHPVSPYAISKATAHWIVRNYREAYGLFACSGFLFNHESFLRSTNFFVKKVITQSIEISQGKRDRLEVGNIDIRRDFGWAPKYVDAMHLMMMQEKADDYIISSGTSVSLRSIIQYVFDKLSVPIEKLYINTALYRPTDIKDIYGNSNKAKIMLGWEYHLSFFEILDFLIDEELSYRNN